jgi:hypothetical protein
MSRPGDKQLTREQFAQIPVFHQAGNNTQQISVLLKCSVDQVRRALKRHGLKPSGGKGGLCYSHADEILEWAIQGLSLSEIGRRIGTDHHKVASFLRRHGILKARFEQSGKNNPAWKGGRMLEKRGYVLILRPDHHEANRHGYVREHRLVMEEFLGRRLDPGEVVHHKDNNPQNNHPDNLELFANNGEHLSATNRKERLPVPKKIELPDIPIRTDWKLQGRWSQLLADHTKSIRSLVREQDDRQSPGKTGRISK